MALAPGTAMSRIRSAAVRAARRLIRFPRASLLDCWCCGARFVAAFAPKEQRKTREPPEPGPVDAQKFGRQVGLRPRRSRANFLRQIAPRSAASRCKADSRLSAAFLGRGLVGEASSLKAGASGCFVFVGTC